MKAKKKSGKKQKEASKQTPKKDPLTLKNADLRTILTLKSKADTYVSKRHRTKKRLKWDQREEGLKFQVRKIIWIDGSDKKLYVFFKFWAGSSRSLLLGAWWHSSK